MKKVLIAIAIVIIALVLDFYVVVYILPLPSIAINDINDAYFLNNFTSCEFEITATLFINKNKTIWTVNGYDFYQGRKTSNIPVNAGINLISIRNGKYTAFYTVYIETSDTMHFKIL